MFPSNDRETERELVAWEDCGMCGEPVDFRQAVRLHSDALVSTPSGFFRVPIDCACVSSARPETIRIQVLETLENEIVDAYHKADDIAIFLVSAREYLTKKDLMVIMWRSGECYLRESREERDKQKLNFYHDINSFVADMIQKRRRHPIRPKGSK